MKKSIRHLGAAAAVVFGAFGATAHAQVNVTTYHNDNSRTGQYTQETVLTPTNVSSGQFGKVFTTQVDGFVYAQPLYMANVSIGGATHNVLYVATQNDTLFAIDADNGAIYWQYNLLPANGVPVSSSTDLNCTDLVPEVGVTGTPVIDPTTGTIYLVAKSKVGTNFFQYLHAIDMGTGAEKFGGPVNIQATFPGTASDGNGTTLTFDALQENQRAALLLENGHVVIGWASHCDNDPWHGWVMSYSASTLAQEAVYNTSPNGYGNGVWMAGSGLVADSSGNIYFATGNGTFDGTSDIGDSIVKLGPPNAGAFPLVDFFTPWNQAALEANDQDLASGGIVLLPALPSGKQLIASMSKPGEMYLVDSSNLGGYCVTATPACTNSNPQIVQDVPNYTVGVWGAPAYWNSSVYWGSANWSGTKSPLQAFAFNAGGSGMLSTTATSQTSNAFAVPAPIPAVSANGTSGGILWGLDNSTYKSECTASSGCQILYAYDATNLATTLYTSAQAANAQDVPGSAVKYVTPIIANGKVYFGSQYAVSGYGLITATVNLGPAPGNFPTAQTVMLTDGTPGAVIHYTTDGSLPTTASPTYSGPLQVSTNTSINAIAVAPGYAMSALANGTYSIGTQLPATPVPFGNTANIYGIVNDGSAVQGSGMDGGAFAYSATLLGPTVSWGGVTFTLGASGQLDAMSKTTLNLPTANDSELYLLATGVNGSQLNQNFIVTYTDGTTTTFTQSLSDWFTPSNFAGESIAQTENYRVNPDGSTDNRTLYVYAYTFALDTSKQVQSISLPQNRNVVMLAITTQAALPATATVTMTPAPGNFSTALTVTLADAMTGALIYYTTDGTTPTTSSTQYTAPLSVAATTTINAIAIAPNHSASVLASGTYAIGAPLPVTNVNFGSSANVYAIGINGTAVPGTGIDGGGYAYSGTLLGRSVAWAGVNFALGAPGALDAVSSATITLPAGNFSKLFMLATGVNGDQQSQTFVVTYTDGTTTTLTQSLSDWFTVDNFPGESIARTESYRLNPDGSIDNETFYVYGYSFAINSTKTVKSLTLPNNVSVVVLAVSLQAAPAAGSVTLSPSPGSFTTPQAVTLTDSTPGAVIHYTTDGSTPTTSSPVYTAAITVSATTTIKALATASGYSTSATVSGTYTLSTSSTPVAATVGLNPAPAIYTTAQSVTLTDSTPGAVIHYTINGTTPTTSSPVYSGAISVSATTTIKALATASGYSTSLIVIGTYTISATAIPEAATVSMSPEPGSFTSAQSVTLSDTTPGATIHYTTDGSAPTVDSPVYNGPVSVSATTTIQALAAAPGYSPSAITSSTYTISTSTGTVTVTAPSKSGGGGALDLLELAVLAGVFFGRVRVLRSRVGQSAGH